MPCSTFIGVGTNTGRATVSEHAIVAENLPHQRKHYRMFYQFSEIWRFVDYVPDTLGLVIIKQGRQVKEILSYR